MGNTTLAIGLISGTSVDGIDAALIEITDQEHGLQTNLIAGQTFDYPASLKADILAVCAGKSLTMAEFCQLDDRIAHVFADAAIALMKQTQTHPDLIGSHGQTVYHRPPQPSFTNPSQVVLGYSMQLGRGAVIAQKTGVKTVSDFRAADIEVGGQGAPLVPMVDWLLLTHKTKNRCVQNIGGISNVAFLAAKGDRDQVFGWDNAPGNVLIDMAAQKLFNCTFDRNGELAAQGQPCLELVQRWLKHEFFIIPPPKSTGRELFSWEYLENCLAECGSYQLSNHDVMATLTELTAQGIAQSYQQFLPTLPQEVLVGGGGSRNNYLLRRLTDLVKDYATVTTTKSAGIHPDFKEAIAFAVLGYLKLYNCPSNLPRVTGASRSVVLGQIHEV